MSVSNVRRRDGGPGDRMTRLGEVMVAALEAHPEWTEPVQGVVMLMDGLSGDGGAVTFGYADDDAAIDALLGYLQALCKASGRPLTIVPVGTN